MPPTRKPAQNGEMEPGEMAVRGPNAMDRLIQQMRFRVTVEDGGYGAFGNTVAAIAAAETEEEFWDADEKTIVNGKDMVDVEQEIVSFEVKRSRNASSIETKVFVDENGKGLYLDVTAVRLDNGETVIWNTSAPNVVAKVMGLQQRDMLPARCVVRATDLGDGQQVLKLKPLPRRIVSG